MRVIIRPRREPSGSIGCRLMNEDGRADEVKAPFDPQPAQPQRLRQAGGDRLPGGPVDPGHRTGHLPGQGEEHAGLGRWCSTRGSWSKPWRRRSRNRNASAWRRPLKPPRAAIRENRMDPGALQNLQRFMSSPPRPNQPIDSEAVRKLTEALEAVAKSPAESPRPKPVAAAGIRFGRGNAPCPRLRSSLRSPRRAIRLRRFGS